MSMVVKNNMSAISTLNTLNKNSSALSKSLAKVSSGMKINSAADDASGYAISERMRVQIRGLDQANSNTQNGTSMMKVAEGAVSSTVDILKTLKEKVINAANDTNTDSDRATIQKELDQSIDQINDNANVTYNGKYLVDGSHNSKVTKTTTSLTNESLSSVTSGSTRFCDMKDRNGNSLNIQASDTITMSVVHEGKTTTYSVRGTAKLSELVGCAAQSASGTKPLLKATIESGSTIGKDIAGDTVSTADGGNALTIKAAGAGVTYQISGLTFSVTNTKGQVQKSANAVLDNFTESIRAQNTSEDNAISLQVGTKANQSIRVGLTDMRAEALGLQSSTGKTIQIGTQQQANAAINVLDNAVQKALDQQTTIGSVESRL
ncbi:flagellin, partial [Selenomonas sp.]|uniref:flagellin n=1 Tax=Selenomonas sp. TaxID=2053611 RepID=UPI002A754F9E